MRALTIALIAGPIALCSSGCISCDCTQSCEDEFCICIGESDKEFCERKGFECGVVSGTDNNGVLRRVDCGECPRGKLCNVAHWCR